MLRILLLALISQIRTYHSAPIRSARLGLNPQRPRKITNAIGAVNRQVIDLVLPATPIADWRCRFRGAGLWPAGMNSVPALYARLDRPLQ